jgi:hypothetical protein
LQKTSTMNILSLAYHLSLAKESNCNSLMGYMLLRGSAQLTRRASHHDTMRVTLVPGTEIGSCMSKQAGINFPTTIILWITLSAHDRNENYEVFNNI